MYELFIVSYVNDERIETSAIVHILDGGLDKFMLAFNTYYFDEIDRQNYQLIVYQSTEDIRIFTFTITYYNEDVVRVAILFTDLCNSWQFLRHIRTYDFHQHIPFIYMRADLIEDDDVTDDDVTDDDVTDE